MLITWKRKPNTRHQHVEPSKLPNEILKQHPQYQNHKIANLWVNILFLLNIIFKYFILEWRANRIEPENPYRNGTYQRIPEFLHVYTKASREERNKLDWNMFSEYELERKDMIRPDLGAYDVNF